MSAKVQRIGIFVIAIVMIVGSLGSFAVMILSTNNAQSEYERQAKEQEKVLAAQQKEADELSAKYYPVFKEYKNSPAPFNADEVGKEIIKKDLKEGTGETITKTTAYKAYYIVWNPKASETTA
jgi:type II secretory pathway pseudopilin PulG